MTANYIVFHTKAFWRAFDKLTEPEQDLIVDKIKLLERKPFYPSLKSKKMKGKSGYYESRVNKDIRLIWQFENGRIILLIDVGHHGVVDKY